MILLPKNGNANDTNYDFSIHAPTRGAICTEHKSIRCRKISIHAPARGAIRTRWAQSEADRISIHAPARGAIVEVVNNLSGGHISIHAPARGAISERTTTRQCTKFQSTHLHEVRFDINEFMIWTNNFNPRTCTRCDLTPCSMHWDSRHFNPRTCTRCDELVHSVLSLYPIFQSTHLHEVRLDQVLRHFGTDLFQSTHLHEVRLILGLWLLIGLVFQSTHLHEVRSTALFDYTAPDGFQSTHLHEVR